MRGKSKSKSRLAPSQPAAEDRGPRRAGHWGRDLLHVLVLILVLVFSLACCCPCCCFCCCWLCSCLLYTSDAADDTPC
eukprot:3596449-Pyramimonas_sp.AAC.1